MTKVTSRARQLRLDYQAKLGRNVTIEEVAAATGIARPTISRLELNQTERIDFETIKKLCRFYGVEVGALLTIETEEQPTNKYRPALIAA
jgi:putative transcriptional regulator